MPEKRYSMYAYHYDETISILNREFDKHYPSLIRAYEMHKKDTAMQKLNAFEKNAPIEFEDKIPEGAMYFEGIASNGDLNRNGYMIRPDAWRSAIDSFLET